MKLSDETIAIVLLKNLNNTSLQSIINSRITPHKKLNTVHHINCSINPPLDVENTWISWQGENCRQFSVLFPLSFIGQFVYPVIGEGMGGWSLVWPHTLFTLLEYMIVWCKIQVIIILWISSNSVLYISQVSTEEQEARRSPKLDKVSCLVGSGAAIQQINSICNCLKSNGSG